MSPEMRQELQRLLSALCDGQLDEARQARLEELLAADPECRRLYLEYLDMHARLLVHPDLGSCQVPPPREGPLHAAAGDSPRPAEGGRCSAGGAPPARAARLRIPQPLRYVLVAAGTLAASLLVQLAWWHSHTAERGPVAGPARVAAPPPAYVATLTRAAGCAWDNPAEAPRVGARLAPGELRLRQGIARVRFDGGPDLAFEGPAVLRLDSATAATVLRGRVVFHGDETGTPFDLHTPSSTLVDIGTEYAVAVGPDGEEVHVFDGEVRRTPQSGSQAGAEQLLAGQARRYDAAADSPGRPVPLDLRGFALPRAGADAAAADPAAGLLAYEGFDYKDPDALRTHKANGGAGWVGPWLGFARPLNEGDQNRQALNVKEGLGRPGAAVAPVGGCFDYTGFAKYYRRLATPVRMNADGVYYLSYLFRREGPPADPVNAVAVLLRTSAEIRNEDNLKRLNVGVGGANQLFTHLNRVGSRTPLPLSNGQTYLLVAKIATSDSRPAQVFMRVYGPDEPVEPEEPGSWSVVGPPFQSDLVFDWLEVHINSKTRQTLDELRLGTTWLSVAAPWMGQGV
jgi:ferric-dicitrate binding protein FerR (iron transport regulator)